MKLNIVPKSDKVCKVKSLNIHSRRINATWGFSPDVMANFVATWCCLFHSLDTRFSTLGFFREAVSPEYSIGATSNFYGNSRRYSKVQVDHLCVSITPAMCFRILLRCFLVAVYIHIMIFYLCSFRGVGKLMSLQLVHARVVYTTDKLSPASLLSAINYCRCR